MARNMKVSFGCCIDFKFKKIHMRVYLVAVAFMLALLQSLNILANRSA
jgi:hypothetical protein